MCDQSQSHPTHPPTTPQGCHHLSHCSSGKESPRQTSVPPLECARHAVGAASQLQALPWHGQAPLSETMRTPACQELRHSGPAGMHLHSAEALEACPFRLKTPLASWPMHYLRSSKTSAACRAPRKDMVLRNGDSGKLTYALHGALKVRKHAAH